MFYNIKWPIKIFLFCERQFLCIFAQMINYCTHIDISRSHFDVSYKDCLLFAGSCFADNIGDKMRESQFRVSVNPFGVLYNPLSVASVFRRLLKPEPFVDNNLFYYDGMYHSFMHHGKFSGTSVEGSLNKINESLASSVEHFHATDYLIITFGTAYVFRFKESGHVVSNCHKLPAAQFERELLTVDRIIETWTDLLEDLWAEKPSLKVIFTVSPIRHLKDGAHFNQISKSTLLLAQQSLVDKYPGRISYFPAYELMMDELRDYRFYASDMIHPSEIAINYIWERFCDTYMDSGTKNAMKEVENICRALKHRPLNPSTEAYKQFLIQTMQKIQLLQDKYPYICLSESEILNNLQR